MEAEVLSVSQTKVPLRALDMVSHTWLIWSMWLDDLVTMVDMVDQCGYMVTRP